MTEEFAARWDAMTPEEQDEYMNGGPGIVRPEGMTQEVLDDVGWHERIYARARDVMTAAMVHGLDLTAAATPEARAIWLEIEATHSRAAARTVKQNIANRL